MITGDSNEVLGKGIFDVTWRVLGDYLSYSTVRGHTKGGASLVDVLSINGSKMGALDVIHLRYLE